jgi:hypothetical protein
MPFTPKSAYLGDGAYVEQDPGGDPATIWLYADRETGPHRVALEPSAYLALKRFVATVWPDVEKG